MAALATKLPQNKEVREKAQQLDEERRAVNRGWQQKDDFLRQTLDLQLFNREADQIDAATSSQEAFLEFHDLGVCETLEKSVCLVFHSPIWLLNRQASLDDVEALQKRHEDFENSLAVQDERLKSFSEAADKLIAVNHYDSRQ